MRQLGELEARIYDNGHRLIPGITHDEAEQKRHVARYMFFKRAIEGDIVARRNAIGNAASIRVLDLGCGVGYGSAILASIPHVSVLGIDVSDESIQYARIHYARPNVEYRIQDILRFVAAMRDDDWDYIVSNEVMEHIEEGIALLRRLKFGRLALISTPYDEAKGVNPHHVLWNITEQSYAGFGLIEFFYTDLQGNLYDKNHQPERTINLIAVIYTPEACRTVRKIRAQIWRKCTIDDMRNFVPKKWVQFKCFVHPVTVLIRSIMHR